MRSTPKTKTPSFPSAAPSAPTQDPLDLDLVAVAPSGDEPQDSGAAALDELDALTVGLFRDEEPDNGFGAGEADSAPGGGDSNAFPSVLPLVPIRDNVYFPHMVFSLYVGRDRSVKALEAATENGSRHILLASQREIANEDPEPADIHPVGIVAEVMQLLKMPDGTVRVMLEGGNRVSLNQFLQTDPFFLVKIAPVETTGETAPGSGGKGRAAADAIEDEALMRTVTQQFERLVTEGRNIPPEAMVSVLSQTEGGRLADTVIPYLSLRVERKQELLELTNARERLEKLSEVLHKEYEILEVQKNIRARVEKEMGETQREFLLREQLKAIQQELGEVSGDGASGEDGWREKIAAAQMPKAVEERVFKELDRLERTPQASPEHGIIRNYLDWLVAMPWAKQTEETLDIPAAEAVLNADHYGLEKIKERILEFLAVRKLRRERAERDAATRAQAASENGGDKTDAENQPEPPGLKGPILCFVGPPGVGKTSLGRSVATALGRPFIRVSLGGVRDEAEIRGHRRTYVGALPGRIVQGVKQAGYRNPVFLLDEIDKVGSDYRGDPSSALLEALDPEQNAEFSDHYLEVPFDLRDVMFITTANLLDPIPAALRDRMEVITFSGYTEDEKLAIAENYLAPKQIRDHGLNPDQLRFEPSSLRRLIREYTREAGVRNLEREVGAICRKVARRFATGETDAVVVTEADVTTFLGGRRFHWGMAEENDEVGAATGLVYTESGGDTVTIEVALTRTASGTGEGRLQLTGQLGDVMKESAQTAWTFVRSRLAHLDLPPDVVAGVEVHIHVPAGAVPKDGPSAGVTLATALASALSGRAIHKDIAMTGEITLRGKVLPVGGVKEKVLAAHRAGIQKVILPAENEKDLEDIPDAVKATLHFEFVTHADEVLRLALGGKPDN